MDEMDASQALLGIGKSRVSVPEDEDRAGDAVGGVALERGEEPTSLIDPSVAGGVDRESARAQFDEAMASIPDADKAAYSDAVRRAPGVVEAESNPDRYLAYDKHDPWRAALRVANYWTSRVEIFGERAFLPMTLTGDGALAEDDVKVFRTGFFMVLPNDSQGRAVLFHDRARLTTSESMELIPRLRCMFYVLSVLAESESTRRNGFVILSVVGKNTRKATLEINTNTRGLALLRSEVILARVVAGHLVVMENRPLLTTFASLIVAASERLNVLKKGEIVVHNHGQSQSDSLVQRLQRHGFDMEGIPTVPFGGLFSFGCFKAWVEDRIRLETSTPGAAAAAAASVTETDVTLAEEDEKRRKKRIDAAYCRRKRFRKKIELEVTQAEVERLQQQNERLREQGSTLEACIQEAHEIVESHQRREQEPVLPPRRAAPHDRAPEGEPPRFASFSVTEALLRSIRPHDGSVRPLGPSPPRAAHGIAHPDLLNASVAGGSSTLLLPPYDRLRETSSLLDASYRDMASHSRLNMPMSPAADRSSMDALEALRRSGLGSDGALASLLLQPPLHHPSRQHVVAAPPPGVADPRVGGASAAAASTTAAERQSVDRLDPYELALLQLYGGGLGGGPPRFF